MSNLHVMIMAGGSGTRFWPRSRRQHPKQFLSIGGEQSLLCETVERARALVPMDRIWILTRADLAEQVRELLPDFRPDRIACEPEMRDTAPALVYGSALVEQVDPTATLLVCPSDHRIDQQAFVACVQGALHSLKKVDGLMTFGIRPSYPATGFGYIRSKVASLLECDGTLSFEVDSFFEKPLREVAEQYLESGDYYWNGGIFLWQLETFKQALAEHSPEHYQGWQQLGALGQQLIDCQSEALQQAFASLPKKSIDFALMEHATNVRVTEATFAWDDVGSWRAVESSGPLDSSGNRTEGRVVALETQNSTVFAVGERVIALLGVEDLVVIDSEDALLICPRDRVEEMKPVVEELRARGWDDVL